MSLQHCGYWVKSLLNIYLSRDCASQQSAVLLPPLASAAAPRQLMSAKAPCPPDVTRRAATLMERTHG